MLATFHLHPTLGPRQYRLLAQQTSIQRRLQRINVQPLADEHDFLTAITHVFIPFSHARLAPIGFQRPLRLLDEAPPAPLVFPFEPATTQRSTATRFQTRLAGLADQKSPLSRSRWPFVPAVRTSFADVVDGRTRSQGYGILAVSRAGNAGMGATLGARAQALVTASR